MKKQLTADRLVNAFSILIVVVMLAYIAAVTGGFKHFGGQEWGITIAFCLIFFAIPQVVYRSIKKLRDM